MAKFSVIEPVPDGPLPGYLSRSMIKTKPNELHVFLAVSKFGGDPGVVTDVVGMKPSEAWVRGDAHPNDPALSRINSRWSLHSGLPPTAPFEEHLGALLDKLESVAEGIREATSRFEAGVWVAAYCREVNPNFRVSSDATRRLAALELPLDLDVYCLPTDPDPGT